MRGSRVGLPTGIAAASEVRSVLFIHRGVRHLLRHVHPPQCRWLSDARIREASLRSARAQRAGAVRRVSGQRCAGRLSVNVLVPRSALPVAQRDDVAARTVDPNCGSSPPLAFASEEPAHLVDDGPLVSPLENGGVRACLSRWTSSTPDHTDHRP
jgi:hypothetical protein